MIVCIIGLVFGTPVLCAVVKEAGLLCSYSCNDGACVGSDRVCDGRVDCADASDEEGCQSNERVIPLLITLGVKRLNPLKSGSTCRKNQWQCGDGTCITFDRICNRLLDCPDGSDEVPTLCQPTQPKSSVIFVSSDGVQPAVSALPVSLSQPLPELSVQPETELPVQPVPELPELPAPEWPEHPAPAVEYDEPPIIETRTNLTTREYCKIPQNPTIIYLCLDSTSGRRRICKTFEPHNTLVQPQCAPFYIPFPGIDRTIALPMRPCQSTIIQSYYCTPDCGVVSRPGTALVEGVDPLRGNAFPWHAVVHWKKTKPYQRICAGSLVGTRFIISAARCFWSAKDMKPLPASEFEVTMGNLYLAERKLRLEEPVQTSSVSKIHIPPRFRGEDGNFQDDIAVVFVTTPFTFNNLVRPVCFDFNIGPDREQLRDGNNGKVAGWWQDDNSLVQIRSLPYVGIEKCIAQSKPSFRSFLTSDKICAGHQPASAFCEKDIGAGLAFAANESSFDERYYLRGVLSVHLENGGCNSEEYATFTQLIKHKSIAETIWAALGAEMKDEVRDEPSVPQTRKCPLPPSPEHGTYVTRSTTLNNVSDEDDDYELVELTVTCHQGYGVQGPTSIKCFNGFWPDKVPKCTQMCALPAHPSVEYRCVLAGAAVGSRACRAHEPPGTLVSPRCREPHYYSAAPLPFMRCNHDARWSYVATCKPDCGRATPRGQELAIGGSNAMHGELPWHAGIYDKVFRPFKQVCGGSLISNHLIISAAHCFWKGTRPLPPSQFAAAVGKLYRPWNDPMDDAQKSNVKHIHIPPRFRGSEANFQDDIAVIVVLHAFEYKSYIRPVCLSFDANFEKKQLQTINKGKVAGWGLTSNNGSAAPVLQVLELPYVEVDTCIAKSPATFVQYITSDKICAGTRNPNTALCRGDSGGGLVFSATENYLQRYYLRGVVSTAPADEANHACNDAVYTCFTQILQHEDFIVPYLTDL